MISRASKRLPFSKGGEAGWTAPHWTQIAAIIAMQSRRKNPLS
jgi:hypothetical protein